MSAAAASAEGRVSRIPNVYHFVFGLRPQAEPFHLLHYLCLESCLRVNRPERVLVHLHNEPHGPLWDLIRPRIEIVPIPERELTVDLTYHDDFTRSFSYAHVSDFIRLRILHEQGGVYADMDTLFLAPPPDELFAEHCVMGRERVDTGAAGAPEGSLCNALIMAEPGSAFIAEWMKRMPGAFDGSWSNHSTFLPYRLSREFPDLVRVEPESRFFALDWTREGIRGLFEEDRPLPPEATSLHLWAHLWWDVERRDMSDFNHLLLTEDYVARARTTYARHARPFLPAPGAPSRKGRALLVTHVLPDPEGVGLARRGWRWACELAARHELEIVLVTPHEPPPPPHPLPGTLRVVPFVPAARGRRLADWFSPGAATAEALGALEGPPPERIIVFRFYLHDVAALLPAAWRAVVEMDCDDWESATRLSLAHLAFCHGDYRMAVRRLREALRYAKLERRCLPAYGVVHLAAEEDAARLERQTGLRIFKASPNKIAVLPGLEPAAPPPGSRTLLFVGALFYPPNADAVEWFAAAVLPRLRRLVPDVRIVVAGRAEEDLKARMAAAGIEYVHAPRDLRPLYAEAAGVIAPVRGGGGTKLKVLEAWLYRRPLVATSHAARGLGAKPGEHLLIADRAEDFARACARLLTEQDLARRLADAGASLVRERFLVDPPPVDQNRPAPREAQDDPAPVFILSVATGYGGAERNIEALLPGLAAERKVVVFACNSHHVAVLEKIDRPGLEIHRIDAAREGFVESAAQLVLRLHDDLKPSAILANTLDSLRILSRCTGGRPELAAKSFFYVHDFQWSGYEPLLPAMAQATLLVPDRSVLDKPDYISRHAWPHGPLRALVLPNPVRIPPEPPEPPAAGAPFLHLATVNPIKGHALLADAAAMLGRSCPDIRIASYGHRPIPEFYRDIQRHAEEVGAGPVLSLHDHVDDPEPLLRRARAVLVTSISDNGGPETFGRSIIEAWAHGRPVIAFAAGAPARLIRHEVDGLLVDEGDVAGLAEAMIRLHRDPELAERLGRNGYARAVREFAADVVRARLTTVLDGGWLARQPDSGPLPAPDGAPGVILDVSLSLEMGWHTPVGMSRVEADVGDMLSRSAAPVRLARRDTEGGGYRRLAPHELEFLANRGDGIGALASRELQAHLGAVPRASRQAAEALEPRAGDVLVSVSNPWDYVPAGTFEELRAKGARCVLVVHDLMVWDAPQWTAGRDPRDYSANMLSVLAQADHLVCVSKATAAVVGRAFAELGRPVPPLPVAHPAGLPPGAAPRGAPPPGFDASRPFVLYCSTIEVRKNHVMLLNLWDRLREALPPERLPRLVMAGRWGWYVDTVRLMMERNWRLAPHVQVCENLRDENLLWLYRKARFTVFPSFTEGFGLPVAESLAVGTPVVVSTAPALIEASGGNMPALDPYDLPAWQREITALCLDDARLEALRGKARHHRVPQPEDLPRAVLAAAGIAAS
ncbi:glycosyltransferase [Xanthobacter sp. V0B-10]|uniref:glycosyltransferase n=1 Tax=Xanthobacter albus TaxID=3119929 RepID=UPI0037298E0C